MINVGLRRIALKRHLKGGVDPHLQVVGNLERIYSQKPARTHRRVLLISQWRAAGTRACFFETLVFLTHVAHDASSPDVRFAWISGDHRKIFGIYV